MSPGARMDERLQAGRHHLLNGDRALQMGYPDDARAHFASALLQFRGPELRLGEAHALRGLGQVEIQTGDVVAAEAHLRAAIAEYQALHPLLDQIDLEGVSQELRRDASEGEASAMTLLGELQLRVGRIEEARSALGYAREIYGKLGDVPSAAATWTALARFAMHESRYDAAVSAYDRALTIHQKSGNLAGQAAIWLSVAELRRVTRDVPGAEAAHTEARQLAQQARNPMLEGRALASLGGLLLQQQRLDEARRAFEAALPLARRVGDVELEGSALVGLGDARSRLHEPQAVDALVEGARLLASIEYHHGLANALLRIGEHGLRMGAPILALAAAEGARRVYRRTDPVHGVGLAYRVIVKALTALQEFEGVLAAAVAREAIAGARQPNAREVAAFYRQRAPEAWVEALKPLGAKGVVERAEQIVARALTEALAEIGVAPESLETGAGALFAVDALVARVAGPAALDRAVAAAALEQAVASAVDPDELEADPRTEDLAVERIFAEPPPEDETPLVLLHPTPASPAATRLGEAGAAAAAEAVEPAPPLMYDGFYEPPTDEVAADEAPTETARAPEPAPVPDALAKAPPPAEYADYYDSPASEDEGR